MRAWLRQQNVDSRCFLHTVAPEVSTAALMPDRDDPHVPLLVYAINEYVRETSQYYASINVRVALPDERLGADQRHAFRNLRNKGNGKLAILECVVTNGSV